MSYFSTIQCFSQRLLNPFRGVMNSITYESAEAVTTDGVHWDIYVIDGELLDGLEGKNILTSEIRYGSWSLEQGLKRGPIYPSDDFTRLEDLGAIVYEHLLSVHDRVPFPFWDRYELWLLDQARQPLALINSVVHEFEIDTDLPIDWRAGLACRRSFTTDMLEQICRDTGTNPGDYLTSYINLCAGERPAAQWFRRNIDGSGLGLAGINLKTNLTGRRVPAEYFPAFFLQTESHDIEHSQLIEEFLTWQAPWILLLNNLDRETRQHYEQLARRHALVVADQYRLYPQVVEESQINAARIEARLRGNEAMNEDDNSPSSFSLDWADSRTN